MKIFKMIKKLALLATGVSLGFSTFAQTPISIPYKSVREAYIALSTDRNAKLQRNETGWEVVTVSGGINEGLWTFVPKGHSAFPAVVKRDVLEQEGKLFVAMDVLCGASKEACDLLVEDFQKLNDKMRAELDAQRSAPTRQ